MPVPVVAGDITDRPYRVVAQIETNVRKWTIFEKDPSEAKVYRELWERARKLGADAVVNVRYGETLYGGLTWGRRHATGQAIKFLSDAEVGHRQASPAHSAPNHLPQVKLVPANTASGYCIEAPADYQGTGSASAPAITKGMPRCNK